MSVAVRALSTFAVLVCAGCFKLPGKDLATGGLPDGGISLIPPGLGVGASCTIDRDCREPLACDPARTCQPVGKRIPGANCVLTADCLSGNYCSPLGRCAESGKGAEGASCTSEGDCQSGLVCALSGLYGTCAKAGLGDYGQPCGSSTECRAGLICAQGRCQTFLTVTPWAGATGCPMQEEATGKIHFQVPRASDPPSEDFFRLPYPNDIRRKDGKTNLTGFPRPGARFLPVDPVEVYAKTIEEDRVGFGLNPTITLRFSRDPALDSLRTDGAVAFYDITAGTPEYGFTIGHEWDASTGGTRYICPRFMTIRPPRWVPLLPKHTYAVVLSRAITDKDGNRMRRDGDFELMLQATAPADPDLAHAWRAYEPFRKWIADKAVKVDDIAVAAVFTTDDVEEPVVKLRAAVRAAPAPVVKNMVKCGGGQPSPCEDMDPMSRRGCRDLDPMAPYDEYQGTIGIVGFQKGTVPFELPTDGGGIERGADGMPAVQRTEDVCFSLTVPRGTAPATGWPVAVYSHGTGGHFRSHVTSGLGADFAAGAIGGAPVPMAMLGYDGVLHGPRKGASKKPTDELVFNYLNPRAARDNSLQGAVDLFVIARALESGAIGAIKVDGSKSTLYGHSQGGNAAALAAPYEPTFGAVVLSGTGGGLILGIMGKKKPVSVGDALPVVLGDTYVSDRHPVMNLLQMYYERADSLNYARRLALAPAMGAKPKHVFHIYGSNDTYSPDNTLAAFAAAAGLPVVHPVVTGDALMQIATVQAPVSLNFGEDGAKVTFVQGQWKPGDYDGHFVSTQNAGARAAILKMLGTYVRDGKPVVE